MALLNAFPMGPKQTLGKYGEDVAAKYLEDRGYEIIERNWRCDLGELDLIARQKSKIVFVEVKTRSGTGYGHPFEAITSIKIARMRKLVSQWCLRNGQTGFDIRLDAIAVLVRNGKVGIEHIKQVS